MPLSKSKRFIRNASSACFSLLVLIFLSVFAPASYAADIEAVTDSTDGTSSLSIKNSSSVEQAHIDSTGNLVTKGCIRVDSGLIECSETEGLIVDGNIGLGTVNPLSKLQVAGGLSRFGLSGTLNFASGAGDVYIQNNLEADGFIIGSRVLSTANVGVGTTSPQAMFQVVGGDALIGTGTFDNTSVATDLYVTGNLEVDGTLYGDGSGITGIVAAGGWSDLGSVVFNTTTTDRVGVGTVSPAGLFSVGSTSQFQINSTGAITASTGIATSGGYTQSGASANTLTGTSTFSNATSLVASGNVGLGTTAPVAGLSVMNGNIGVGTWSPVGSLEVRGGTATRIWTGAGTDTNATLAGELYVEGDLEVDGTLYGDGSGLTSLPTGVAAGGWNDGGPNVYTITTTDTVGIGTTTASSTIEIVKQGTSVPLMVSATATGDGNLLIVTSDGNTGIGTIAPRSGLSVMNGNVGIGTTSAGAALAVGGTSQFQVNTAGAIAATTGIATSGGYVQSGSTANTLTGTTTFSNATALVASGNVGLGTTAPVGALTVMNGNVGVGTWSPVGSLEVRGGTATRIWTGAGTDTNATLAGELYVEGDFEVDGTIYGDGSGLTSLPSGVAAGGWTDGGTNVYNTATSDNVGIGTTTPNAATLEIVKNAAQPTLKISSTATGAGDVLLVSSTGNIGVGTLTPVGGWTVMNGNAGIGTWSPTSKLQVVGTVSATAFAGDGSGLTNLAAGATVRDADNNTKVQTEESANEDYIRFDTAATERMVIDPAGNVGIATANPANVLAVGSTSQFQVSSTGAIAASTGIATSGGYTQSGTTANTLTGPTTFSNATTAAIFSTGNVGVGTTSATVALLNVNGEAYVAGPVGIGTFTPTGIVDIRQDEVRIWTGAGTSTNATAAGELYVEGDLEVDGTIYGDGSGLTSLPSGVAAGGWTDGGVNVYTTATSDAVGIGTTTPSTTLEIVKQGSSAPLMISGTPTGDGDYLTVASTGNVGIGVIAPRSALAVTGNIGIGTTNAAAALAVGAASEFQVNSSGAIAASTGIATSGGYTQSGTTANTLTGPTTFSNATTAAIFSTGNVGVGTTSATVALLNVNGEAYVAGPVGIGTFSPTGIVDIRQDEVRIWTGAGTNTNALAAGELYVEGDLEVDGTIYGDGSGITSLPAGVAAGGWTDGGTNVYNTTTSDNVGIGTTTPTSTLEVVKTGAGTAPLMVSTTATSDGNLLLIASDGNTGIGTTTPVGGLTVMNGNAGIGTWSPTAKLQVVGTVSATTFVGDGGGLTNVISGGGWIDGGTNIYTATTTDTVGVGTTTASSTVEIVKQGSSVPLMVSGSATGDGNLLIVTSDGNTGIGTIAPRSGLSVMNGNLGIGTTNAAAALAVGGASEFQVNTAGAIAASTGIATSGGYTQSGVSANTLTGPTTFSNATTAAIFSTGNVGVGTTSATVALLNVNGEAYVAGPVGIGTFSPTGIVDIRQDEVRIWTGAGTNTNSLAAGELYVEGDLEVDGTIYGDGSGITALPSTLAAGGWSDGGTNIYTTTTTDNVGIGTTTPNAATLEIVKNAAQPTLKVSSTATANGDFLIINSQGNVGLGTIAPVGALTIMNGNVGVGTWSPTSQIQVIGNVSVTDEGYGGTWDGSTHVPTKNAVYDQVQSLVLGGAGGWTDGGTNVYNSNTTDMVGIGTTTASTTLEIVRQGSNAPLMISGTAAGDGDLVMVTSSGNVGVGTVAPRSAVSILNGNVGIGTTNAAAALAVGGASEFQVNTAGAIAASTGIATSGGYTQSGATANTLTGPTTFSNATTAAIFSTGNVGVGTTSATVALLNVNGEAYVSGPVGIGTFTPTGIVDIRQDEVRIWTGAGTNTNSLSAGELYVEGDLEVDGTIYGDGSGITALPSTLAAGGWSDGGTNIYTTATTDNVGIGTTTPNAATLEIVKNAAQPALKVSSTAAANGDFFLINSQGNVGIGTTSATVALLNVNGEAYVAGPVGIGTFTPTGIVDIRQDEVRIWTGAGTNTNALAAGELYVEGDLEVDGTIYGDGSGLTSLPAGVAAGGWTDGGTNVYNVTTTDTVGIGTTTPSTTLEIVKQGSSAPLMISGTATGDGDYLMVSSSGNIGVGTVAPRSAVSILSGNVGIGTTNAAAALAVGGASEFQVTTAGAIAASTGIATSGGYTQSGTGANTLTGTTTFSNATTAAVFSTGNVGVGTTATTVALLNVNGEAYVAGPVGIGTFSPTGIVDIRQDEVRVWTGAGTDTNATAAGELYVEGDLEVDGTIYGDGSGITGAVQTGGGWVDGGTNVFLTFPDDNVGLGTTLPSATLEVIERGVTPLMVSSTFASDGDLLIIQSSGNIGIGTSTPGGGLSIMNGNVGIGSLTPTEKLSVVGTVKATAFVGDGSGLANISGTVSGLNAGFIPVATSGSIINDSLIFQSGTNTGIGTNTPIGGLTIMTGNVGIGTWNPIGALEVKGRSGATRIWTGGGTDTNATLAGELYVEGDLEVDGTIYGDGTGITGAVQTGGGWVDGGTDVFLTFPDDNVGIGTTDPTATLELIERGVTPLMISSIATSDGDLMIVQPNGNVGFGTTTPEGALTVMNGNVGIGTWVPAARLQVAGTVAATAFAGDGSGLTGIATGGGWTDGGTNVYTAATTDTVGIGTTTPSTTLEIVKQGSSAPLMVSATATGDGDYLMVASSGNIGVGTIAPRSAVSILSGNVGIGTTNAAAALAVGGASEFQVNTAGAIAASTGIATSGGYTQSGTSANTLTGPTTFSNATTAAVFSTGNVGVGTTATTVALLNVNGEAYVAGPVGIGTFSPTGIVDIRQDEVRIWTGAGTNTNSTAAGELYVEGDLEVDGTIYGDGSGLTSLPSGVAAGGWTDGGTNVYNTTTTDNVGIGTTTPTSTLEIVKTAAATAPLMVSSTATGDGNLLIITSDGNTGIGTVSPRSALAVLNGSVGIGTTNAAAALAVGGASEFQVNTAGAIAASTGIATSGGYTQSGTTANTLTGPTTFSNATTAAIFSTGNVGVGTTSATVALLNVNGEAYMAGPVGIGTFTPTGIVDIRQDEVRIWTGAGTNTNALAAGELYVEGDLEVDGTIYGDGSGLTALPAGVAAGGWMDGGTNVYNTTTTDNVGIGTTTPNAATLEIVKNAAQPTLKISSTATGGGDVLLVSSAGNVGIGTLTPVGGFTVMNGNAGIGTWSPTAKLQVVGTVGATAFVGDGSGLTNLSSTTSGWIDGGTNVYNVTTTDTVGIGTTTPSTTLEIVKQGSSAPLMVSATATGDGDYLMVASSGNVGIGVTAPRSALAVTGNIGIGTTNAAAALAVGAASEFQVNSSGAIAASTGIATSGGYTQSGATANTLTGPTTFSNATTAAIFSTGNVGVGTTSTTVALLNVNGEAYVAGPVGIGTFTPTGIVDIRQDEVRIWTGAGTNTNSTAAGELYVEGDLEVDGTIYGDGSGITALPAGLAAGGWTDGGTNVYATTTTDNVGIGTTTPNAATLEIVKNAAQPTLKISSTATGAGDVLLVSSAGNIGVGTLTPVGALTVMNGNVGVGTWSPTQRLQVVGTVGATAFVGDGAGLTGVPAGALIRDGDNNTRVQTEESANEDYLRFDTAANERMVIDPAGNVGIATANPANLLAVGSTSQFQVSTAGAIAASTGIATSGGYTQSGTSANTLTGTTTFSNATTAAIFSTGNVGIGTTSTTVALLNVNGEAYVAGPVGIGTFTPTGIVDIRQDEVRVWTGAGTDTNATAAGELYVEGDLEVDGIIYGDGSGLTSLPAGVAAGGWTDGGTNIYTSTTTDNVGIGTTTPTSTLEIVKTAAGTAPLMVSTTATGDGNLLLIASDGNTGIGTTTPVGGLTVMNGNAGIGTWSPTSKLQVVGTVGATAFVGDGSGLTNVSGAASGWVDGGTNVYNVTTTDTVGIGTTTASSTIEIVKQGSSAPLMVSATATGDGDYLMVASSGNVGIGVVAPRSALAVTGNIGIGTTNAAAALAVGAASEFQVNSSGAIAASTGIATSGGYTQSGTSVNTLTGTTTFSNATTAAIFSTGNVGVGTTATTVALLNVNGEAYVAGPVGIGTFTPTGIVDIRQDEVRIWTGAGTNTNATAAGELYVEGDLEVDGTIYGDGSGITSLPSGLPAGGWSDGGTNVYTTTTTDNVGIGTTTPNAATLEIVKNAAQPTLKISSTATGAGDFVLVSSAGNVGVGTLTPVGALTVMNGNVGIGTWSPTSRLQVVGTVGATAFVGDGSGLTSLAAGSVIRDGDNNTKVQAEESANEDYLRFDTAATERMVIDPAGNVGIATANPANLLAVGSTSQFQVSGTGAIAASTGIATSGGYTQSGTSANTLTGTTTFSNATTAAIFSTGNVGVGTTATTVALLNVNGEAYVAGPVGIGTFTPTGIVDIRQDEVRIWTGAGTNTNATAAGELYVEGDLEVDGTIYGDGSGLTSLPAGVAAGGWTDGGTNVYNTTTTDNVGIGTTTPTSTLEIVKTAAGTAPLMVSTTATGDGNLLLIASDGNTGIGTTTPVGGFTVMNGNVGIGTWSPTARLQVVGTVGATAFVGDGSGLTGVAGTNSGWVDGGTNVYNVTTTDTVGIGTTTPSTTLEIVKQGSSAPLMVSATATGDGDYLMVASSGNVGIGVTAPRSALAVTGNIGIGTTNAAAALAVGAASEFQVNSSGAIAASTGIATSGGYTQSGTGANTLTGPTTFSNATTAAIFSTGNVGVGTTATTVALLNVNGEAYVAGPLGIGTFTPTGIVDIRQDEVRIWTGAGTNTNATAAGELYVEGDLEVDGTIYGDGSGITALPSTLAAGGWSDGGTNVYTTATTDNVGIGTTTPNAATLEIVKNAAQPTLKISSTATGAGDFLLVSSAGNIGVGTLTPVGALTIMNGNVGIGTWSPTSRLQVAGTVGATAFVGDGSGLTSLSAGSVIRDGDNNTKVQAEESANEDYLRFDTAATERMVIDPAGNVGIATANPANVFSVGSTSQFQVSGAGAIAASTGIATSGGYTQSGTGANTLTGPTTFSNATTAAIFSTGNVGVGTTATTVALLNVNGEAYVAGPVGIGTFTPTGIVDIRQDEVRIWTGAGTDTNATAAGELYVEGDLEVDGTIYGDGSGLTSLPTGVAAGGWTDGGTNVYTTATTDNVGIGTTTPTAALLIENAGTQDSFRVNDAVADASPFVIDSAGNVGIGTTVADGKLVVTGGSVGIGHVSHIEYLLDVRSSSVGDAQAFFGNDSELGLRLGAGPGATAAMIQGSSVHSTDNIPLLLNPFAGNVGIGTTTPVGGLTVMNGNVGIGTWSPTQRLQVVGTVGATAFVGDGSGLTGVSGTNSGWVDGGTNVYNVTTTDTVGIGTTTASSTVEIVKQGSSAPLMVSATATGDGDYLMVASSGNVGIGVTAPRSALAVTGNIGIGTTNAAAALAVGAASEFQVNSSGAIAASTGIATSGGYTQSGTSVNTLTGTTTFSNATTAAIFSTGNVGVGTTSTTVALLNVNGEAYVAGPVGIGTFTPTGIVDIRQDEVRIWTGAGTNTNATAAGELYVEGDLEVDGTIYGDGSGITALPAGLAAGGWTDGGTNVYTTTTTDNVGIGTTTPNAATLEIVKNAAQPALKISSAATGSGDFLIVKSDGNVGIGTVAPRSAMVVMNGSVGIGTTHALAPLHVMGHTHGSAARFQRAVGDTGISLNYGSFDNLSIGFNAYQNDLGGTFKVLKTGFVGMFQFNSLDGSLWYMANSGGAEGNMLQEPILTIANSGNVGIGTSTSVGGLTVMTGNVGIGTWSPTQKLQVVGTVGATAFVGDGSGLTNLPASGGWTDGGTNVYTTATTDNVGIGTTTPNAATLEIVKNAAQPALKISSTATGAGDFVLVSSAGNVGVGTITPVGALTVMNGNVGIGTWSPQSLLSVGPVSRFRVSDQGAVYARKTSDTFINLILDNDQSGANTFADIQFRTQNTAAANISAGQDSLSGYMMTFHVNSSNTERMRINSQGIGMGTTTPVGGLVVMNGNVGIGTWSPIGQLEVRGGSGATRIWTGAGTDTNATAAGELYVEGDLEVDGTIYGDGSGITALPAGLAAGGWTDGGTNVYTTTTTDNVGIGTTTPNAATLEIVKNAAQPMLKISSSATGAGDVLSVGSSGNIGIGTTAPVGAMAIMTGNVGVGTFSPTSRFEVLGAMGTAIVAKTGNYTATINDSVIVVDASGGAVTITLPAAAATKGRIYHVKKTDASNNSIVIDANGSETIDGALTVNTTTPYHAFTLVCDGSNWWVI